MDKILRVIFILAVLFFTEARAAGSADYYIDDQSKFLSIGINNIWKYKVTKIDGDDTSKYVNEIAIKNEKDINGENLLVFHQQEPGQVIYLTSVRNGIYAYKILNANGEIILFKPCLPLIVLPARHFVNLGEEELNFDVSATLYDKTGVLKERGRIIGTILFTGKEEIKIGGRKIKDCIRVYRHSSELYGKRLCHTIQTIWLADGIGKIKEFRSKSEYLEGDRNNVYIEEELESALINEKKVY